MAKQFARMDTNHQAFIAEQQVFFVASAAEGSRINLSPKGLDALRILDDQRVAYLDLTGSSSETSAHLLADGRLTIMVCAFQGPPLILRLYGRGLSHLRGSARYQTLLSEAFVGREPLGARQIVELEIDLVQTSCGFGVPLFSFEGERPSLPIWAEKKGEEGLDAYRREKNARSMDGLTTGFFAD